VLRALLLVLAAAALAVAVVRGGEDRDCASGQRDAYAIGIRTAASADLDPAAVARDVEDACRGGAPLAAAATGLLRGGASDGAARLARAATRRDPEDFRGWRALAGALEAAGDRAGAAAAARRAAALSPTRPAPG
jgi:Flp pilus assembly protein TadD